MNKMLVFAIWNLKGGVGKTTSAVNLAYNLSLRDCRVLLIDADPQTNCSPFFIRPYKNKYSVYDLVTLPKKVKSYIYRTKYRNIDIIKGCSGVQDSLCESDAFQMACEQIRQELSYDIVIIDCRTSCEALTKGALEASDVVLTPILLDGYCRDNLKDVKINIDKVKLNNKKLQWHVFANRVRNTRRQRKILEDLIQKHDYPIMDTCIYDREAVFGALNLKKPLQRHASKNQATLDFIELTDAVLMIKEEVEIYG